MSNILKYIEGKKNGDIKKEYQNLYDVLVDGDLRDNDDFRILQYECAIRSCYNELIHLIPYNGEYITNLPSYTKDKLKLISKSGLNVIGTTSIDNSNDVVEYIELDYLHLKYCFLEEVKPGRFYNDIYDTGNSLPNNRHGELEYQQGRIPLSFFLSNSNKSKKDFIKLFGMVLDSKTKKTRKQATEKIVDMFYVYDQSNIYNIKKGIDFIFSKPSDTRTTLNHINLIQNAIHTYTQYN
jgi:hypothetical protein